MAENSVEDSLEIPTTPVEAGQARPGQLLDDSSISVNVDTSEVVSQLTERGQLEWENATLRALFKKSQELVQQLSHQCELLEERLRARRDAK